MSNGRETQDRFARPLRSLRLSVTDRCNLRCNYCMPEPDYEWLPRADILDFDELERLAGIFRRVGVDRVRLTGGEPMLRKDLPVLVDRLARVPGLREVAMTTNGVLLERGGAALRDAGLGRITVSLDTLRKDRYRELTQRDAFDEAMRGIDRAVELWPGRVKINTVVVRGYNDDELVPLLEFARDRGAELRFIEYMDVGGATQWRRGEVVSRKDMLAALSRAFGEITPAHSDVSAPADRFTLHDGTSFGIIASTTEPFCANCDRARVTADGTFLTCLYARLGIDLRRVLRDGSTDDEVLAKIERVWSARVDRGAEQRLAIADRGALAAANKLREDPHLEMHTRGG